jgi:hypothetical protein
MSTTINTDQIVKMYEKEFLQCIADCPGGGEL